MPIFNTLSIVDSCRTYKMTDDESMLSSFVRQLGERTSNSASSSSSLCACFLVARGKQLKPHMPQWPTEGGRLGPSCVEVKQWVLGDMVRAQPTLSG